MTHIANYFSSFFEPTWQRESREIDSKMKRCLLSAKRNNQLAEQLIAEIDGIDDSS